MHLPFKQVFKSSLQKPTLGIIVCWCLLSMAVGTRADIQTKNPFLPHNYGKKAVVKTPPPQATANGPLGRELELRGIVKMGGRYRFSIFNRKENKGYWIPEAQSKAGISVGDYDLDAKMVVVSKGQQTEQLTLKMADSRPLPVRSTGPSISTGAAKDNRRTTAKPGATPIQTLINKTNNQTSSPPTKVRRRVILPRK
jgi:hypothetical protein